MIRIDHVRRVLRHGAVAGAFCFAAGAVVAQGLADGAYSVWLTEGADASEASLKVAEITVTDGRYSVAMEAVGFSDHFLSMRPFKCLDDPETLWCHVPYPYQIKRDVSGDLTDLEYDFLFVWKPSGSYGIDLWNGIYYRLEDAGEGLIGHVQQIDMDVLSVPPAAGEMRPITPSDLHPGDPEDFRLPVMQVLPIK